MGYRLTMLDENDGIIFYGTKLYGYVEGLEAAKGVRFLWDEKREEIIDSGCFIETFEDFVNAFDIIEALRNPLCVLSRDQAIEFLRLYKEDLITWEHGTDCMDKVNIPCDIEFVKLAWE